MPERQQDTETGSGCVKRMQINVDDGFEVRHWAKESTSAPSRSSPAIKKVGPAVNDIRRELKREGLRQRLHGCRARQNSGKPAQSSLI